MAMKIGRNLRTEAGRKFWAAVERDAAKVARWPAWKRAAAEASKLGPLPGEPIDTPDCDGYVDTTSSSDGQKKP